MKLLIDIGNTNTSIATLEGGRIRKRYFIHTAKKQLKAEAFARLIGIDRNRIDSAFVVSVVPVFLALIRKSLAKAVPGISVKVVGINVKVPIRNRYKRPREVGQDRLVTAFAASGIYGAPVLVLDFGTAVTLDYVNEKSEYLGGLIFPGLRLSLQSLVRHTALLPEIEIEATAGLIGRNTKDSMNKGLLMGYAAMCDGLIERFRKKYGRAFKVVATGGDARLISRYSRHIKTVSPNLILRGLKMMCTTAHVPPAKN